MKEAIKAFEELKMLRQKMNRNGKDIDKPLEPLEPGRPSKNNNKKDEQ